MRRRRNRIARASEVDAEGALPEAIDPLEVSPPHAVVQERVRLHVRREDLLRTLLRRAVEDVPQRRDLVVPLEDVVDDGNNHAVEGSRSSPGGGRLRSMVGVKPPPPRAKRVPVSEANPRTAQPCPRERSEPLGEPERGEGRTPCTG